MNPEILDQFNSIYKIRSKLLKSTIKTINSLNICNNILDLNDNDQECIITGILFISSDLKSTIFDKINVNKSKTLIKKETYMSNDVKYFMEDETGRIELLMMNNINVFITTGMWT